MDIVCRNENYGALCVYTNSLPTKVGSACDLHNALKTGKITARGQKQGDCQRNLMTQNIWMDCKIIQQLTKSSKIKLLNNDDTMWNNIMLNMDDVIRVFPLSGSKPSYGKRGRSKNSGYNDDEAISYMKVLLDSRECTNMASAGRLSIEKLGIQGNSEDSILRRLRVNFNAKYPK